MCKNEPKCAQFEENHHSLNSQYQIIREYKYRLKEQVEEAINSGKLNRFEPIAERSIEEYLSVK